MLSKSPNTFYYTSKYIVFTFSSLERKTSSSNCASSLFKKCVPTFMGIHSEMHIYGCVIPFQFALAVRVHWDHLGLVEKIQTPDLLSLEPLALNLCLPG